MSSEQALVTAPAPKAVAHLSHNAPMAIVPATFDDVFRMAQAVAQSGLAPYGMDTPQQITVAICTGLELGVKPMQAIQGIAVINKRPCVWGDLALAICRSTGELEYITETFEGDEPEEWGVAQPSKAERKFKAVCRVKRKGQPEVVSEFSIGDAVVAKLWQKKGHNGKDTPWVTTPKRMLKMRARGFALRDLFTDALKGLYIAEELQGTEEIDNRPAIAPAPPPEVQAALETRKDAPQARGPQPPPEIEAEEAVFTEAPAEQQKPQEPEANPSQQREEFVLTFDVPAFFQEVEDTFAACRTESDVSEAHDGFADRVEASLTRSQREQYDEKHAKALERIERERQDAAQAQAPKGPVDDDGDEQPAPELPPHEIVAGRFRMELENCETQDDVNAVWNQNNRALRKMVKDGLMTEDFRKGLFKLVEEAYEARAKPAEPADEEEGDDGDDGFDPSAETKPEQPATEQPVGEAEPDTEIGKFTDEFRVRIAALVEAGDGNGFNALVVETQERRDAFKAQNPAAAEVFRAMIQQARKNLAGV